MVFCFVRLNLFFSHFLIALSYRLSLCTIVFCVCVCAPLFVRYSHYWCIGGFLNHIRIIVNNPYPRVIVSDCRIDLFCSTANKHTERKREIERRMTMKWERERDRVSEHGISVLSRCRVNNANAPRWNKTKQNKTIPAAYFSTLDSMHYA